MSSAIARRLLVTLVLLATLIAFVEAALAQSTHGGVVGTVSDASQAVLLGALVTLTEVETRVTRTGVKLVGFQKASVVPFSVAARQTVRIDVGLDLSLSGGRVVVLGYA